MPDWGIFVTFGLLAIVVAGSLAWFRRHSFGMAARVVLSIVAVGLMIIPPAIRGELDTPRLLTALAAAGVLGISIVFLRKHQPPPE